MKLLHIFLVLSSVLFAEIVPIQSFKEAEFNMDEATLVIFDIDDVLITPSDALFQPKGQKISFPFLDQKGLAESEYLLSIAFAKMPWQTIDPNTTGYIEELQKKGTNVLALTAARTGKFGVIEDAVEWRIVHLKEQKIDFSPSFPYPDYLEFPELVKQGQNPPVFKSGILFGGDLYDPQKSSKGLLLTAFFDRIDWSPKKVVFFDDRIHNLESVEEALKKRGIEFKGYHFIGAVMAELDEFDENAASYQLQHLTEKKEWMSHSEAKSRIEAGS